MSIQALAWARKTSTGNPYCKAVLMDLALFANAHDRHSCRPTIAAIATRTEMSGRTVSKWIKWLHENGLIEIKKEYVGSPLRIQKEYILNVSYSGKTS